MKCISHDCKYDSCDDINENCIDKSCLAIQCFNCIIKRDCTDNENNDVKQETEHVFLLFLLKYKFCFFSGVVQILSAIIFYLCKFYLIITMRLILLSKKHDKHADAPKNSRISVFMFPFVLYTCSSLKENTDSVWYFQTCQLLVAMQRSERSGTRLCRSFYSEAQACS